MVDTSIIRSGQTSLGIFSSTRHWHLHNRVFAASHKILGVCFFRSCDGSPFKSKEYTSIFHSFSRGYNNHWRWALGNGAIFLLIITFAGPSAGENAHGLRPQHPQVRTLGFADIQHYITDSCDKNANVNISLGAFQYYVKTLPALQCVEILTTGILSGVSCSLPPHCGEVTYTNIRSGLLSSVGRCEGLGFTGVANANESNWLKGWKLVYNFTTSGVLETVSSSMAILYDFDKNEYEMVPLFSLEYEYMKLIGSDLIIPEMIATDDTRFCRERLSPSQTVQMAACSSSNLNELLCACRLPAYTNVPSFTSATDKLFVYIKDQAFSYRVSNVPDVSLHVKVEYFTVSKGLYVVCPAYTMSGSITTQYLKGLGSALASSLLAIIGTLWQYISVLVFEFLSVAITPTTSSAMVYATLVQMFLYKNIGVPHPYVVLIVFGTLVSVFSLIIISLH